MPAISGCVSDAMNGSGHGHQLVQVFARALQFRRKHLSKTCSFCVSSLDDFCNGLRPGIFFTLDNSIIYKLY